MTCCPSDGELVEAINLLRLIGRTDLLPYAFYRLVSLDDSTKAIFRGGTRADGTPEHLSQEDLERCFSASHLLIHANLYVAAELVTAVPSAKCVGHASTLADCAQLPAAERMSVLDDPEFFAQPHPLGSYYSIRIPTFLEGERLCAACASAMDKRLYYLQSEVWEALPAYFDLSVDDWNSPLRRRISGRA